MHSPQRTRVRSAPASLLLELSRWHASCCAMELSVV